jgi:hypothetical protein
MIWGKLSYLITMNWKKLFGLSSKEKKPYEHAGLLHLWEDDYLMIELLPRENLAFLQKEMQRIDDFGKEHFDGTGFTDMTVMGEKPIKTIDRGIPLLQAAKIFEQAGLQKIEKFVAQGAGLLEGDQVPLGYGSPTFAVMLERQEDLLADIWFTGNTKTDEERQSLHQGFQTFGRQFDFIGADWFRSEYHDLNDEKQLAAFIQNSC